MAEPGFELGYDQRPVPVTKAVIWVVTDSSLDAYHSSPHIKGCLEKLLVEVPFVHGHLLKVQTSQGRLMTIIFFTL